MQWIIDYIDVCLIIDCNQLLYNMLSNKKKSTTSMLYFFENTNYISSKNTVSTVQVDIVLEIKWLFIMNEMRVQMSKNNQYRKFSLLHYVNDCFSYMLKV